MPRKIAFQDIETSVYDINNKTNTNERIFVEYSGRVFHRQSLLHQFTYHSFCRGHISRTLGYIYPDVQ